MACNTFENSAPELSNLQPSHSTPSHYNPTDFSTVNETTMGLPDSAPAEEGGVAAPPLSAHTQPMGIQPTVSTDIGPYGTLLTPLTMQILKEAVEEDTANYLATFHKLKQVVQKLYGIPVPRTNDDIYNREFSSYEALYRHCVCCSVAFGRSKSAQSFAFRELKYPYVLHSLYGMLVPSELQYVLIPIVTTPPYFDMKWPLTVLGRALISPDYHTKLLFMLQTYGAPGIAFAESYWKDWPHVSWRDVQVVPQMFMKDTRAKVTNLLDNSDRLLPEVHKATAAISKMAAMAEGFPSIIKGMLTSFVNDDFPQMLDKARPVFMARIEAFGLALLQLFRSESLVDYGIAIAQLMNSVGITLSNFVRDTKDGLIALFAYLHKNTAETSADESQTPTSDSPDGPIDALPQGSLSDMGSSIFKSLSNIIAHLFEAQDSIGALSPKRSISFKELLSTFNVGSTAIINLQKLFNMAYDQVYFWVYGYERGETAASVIACVESWISRTSEFLTNNTRASLGFDASVTAELKCLVDEGHLLVGQLNSPRDRTLLSRLREFYTPLSSYFVTLNNALYLHSDRQRPVIVYVYGPPGLGKSVFLDFLCAALIGSLDLRGPIRDHVFHKTPGSKYYEGYRKQAITMFDDANQDQRADAITEFILDIEKMGNDATFSLNMPDLESKAVTLFVSSFVIISANVPPHTASGQVADLGAYYRRLDLILECINGPQTDRGYSLDGYAFKRVDYRGVPFKDHKFDFGKVVSTVLSAYKKYSNSGAAKKARMEAVRNDYADRNDLTDNELSIQTAKIAQAVEQSHLALSEAFAHYSSLPGAEEYVRERAEERGSEIDVEIDVDEQMFSAMKRKISIAKRPKVPDSDTGAGVEPPPVPVRTTSEVVFEDEFGACLPEDEGELSEHDLETILESDTPEQWEKPSDKYRNVKWTQVPTSADKVADLGIEPVLFDTEDALTSVSNYIPEFHNCDGTDCPRLDGKNCAKQHDNVAIKARDVVVTVMNATAAAYKHVRSVFSPKQPLLAKLREAFIEYKNKAVEYLTALNAKYPMLKYMGIGMAALALLVGAIVVFKSGDEKPQMTHSGASTTPKAQNRYKHATTYKRALDVKPQYSPNRVVSLLDGPVARNLYEITAYRGKQPVAGMSALGIVDRWYVVPRHFFESATCMGIETIALKHPHFSEAGIYRIENLVLVPVEGQDLMFFQLPFGTPSVRDITKHFICEGDTGLISGKAVCMVPCDKGYKYYHMEKLAPITNVLNYGSMGKSFKVGNVFRHEVYLDDGDCGSPYSSLNNRCERTLFGVHVAADRAGKCGFGAIITQEIIANSIGDRAQAARDNPLDHPSWPAAIDLHKVPISESSRIATKTKIMPSILFDEIYPHQKVPAALTPIYKEDGTVISPIEVSVSRATQVFEMDRFHEDLVIEAGENMALEWGPAPESSAPITWDEAVNGRRGCKYMRALHMGTSSGLGCEEPRTPDWKLLAKGGKLPWFTMDGNVYIMSEVLMSSCEMIEEHARKGLPVVPNIDFCLKDELRSFEKVDTGATRGIWIAPLDYLIVVRRWFLEPLSLLMDRHLESWMALGVNPHSRAEWTTTAKSIGLDNQEFSRLMCLDHSNFDGRILALYSHTVLLSICEWIGGPDLELRMSLVEGLIVNRRHVAYWVFDMIMHNITGHPITAWLNSGVCRLNERAIFLKLSRAQGLNLSFEDFRHIVRSKIYGDDNASNIGVVTPWYNQITFTEAAAGFGFKMTNASKTGDMKPYVSLSEFTFLKRGFVMDESGNFHAPLDEGTIKEMVQWTRTDTDDIESLYQVVECAFREWYHHGPKRFAEETAKINAALVRLGHKGLDLSYAYLHTQWLNGVSAKWEDFESSHEIDVLPQMAEGGPTNSNVDHEVISGDDPFSLTAPVNTFNPYPNEAPEALGREYQIDSFSWTASQPIDTTLGTHNHPQKSFATQQKLRSLTERMIYFRGDVEITIRTSATQMHTGSLLVSYNQRGQVEGASLNKCFAGTFVPYVVIDLATNPTAKVLLRWNNPRNWALLDEILTGHDISAIGIMTFIVLHPMNVAMATPSTTVTVNVFARFVNFALAGPTLDIILPSLTVHPQGKSKEQLEKSSQGLISGITEKISQTATVFSGFPVIGTAASAVAAVSGGISAVAKAFGFNKPISVAAVMPTIPAFASDHALGSGLSPARTLGMDPENSVATDSAATGSDEDNLSFAVFLSHPCLVTRFSFDSTKGDGAILAVIPNSPSIGSAQYSTSTSSLFVSSTRLNFTGSNFQYWTGSLKYRLLFTASPFQACQVRISWHPTEASVPTTITAGDGDILSTLIVIKGGCVFDVTVPYLNRQEFASTGYPIPSDGMYFCNPEQMSGFLVVSVEAPVVAPQADSSTIIWCSIFQAAGEDFQFHRPTDVPNALSYTYTDPPTSELDVVPQSGSYALDFKRPFPSLVSSSSVSSARLLIGEVVKDFRTLFHRHSGVNTFTIPSETTLGGSDKRLQLWYLDNVPQSWQIQRFLRCFMGYRGSFIYRFMPQTNVEYRQVSTTVFQVQPTDFTGNMWVALISAFTFATLPANPSVNVDLENMFGTNGVAVVPIGQEPFLTVHAPYQVPWRYLSCAPYGSRELAFDGTAAEKLVIVYQGQDTATAASTTYGQKKLYLSVSQSFGDDFSVVIPVYPGYCQVLVASYPCPSMGISSDFRTNKVRDLRPTQSKAHASSSVVKNVDKTSDDEWVIPNSGGSTPRGSLRSDPLYYKRKGT